MSWRLVRILLATMLASVALLGHTPQNAAMAGEVFDGVRPSHGAPASEVAQVDPSVLAAEARRVEVIDRAKQAAVAVFSANSREGGSGVVISPDGLALTNFHVVQPCGHWMKCGMADGKIYDAVLVGVDPTGDVALIKLLGRDDFPRAALGDSDAASVGDWVFAVGNPFLLATDLQPTVTMGIISGTHRYQYPSGTLLEYTDCLQTDAAINPGNSGGPLFDAGGRLLGVNGRCSFEKRGRVSVGVAYAVSINQIKNFLGCLASGRVVDHATLGFRTSLDADGRVVIDEILPSSDAYRRGLRYGDEIVRFAGRAIDSPNALLNAVGVFPQGWRLPVSYRREGKRRDTLVRLASLHRESPLWEAVTRRREIKPPPQRPRPQKDRGEQPISPPSLAKKRPVPQAVQQHYAARRGYANYFFNRRNQERLWQGWTASLGSPENVAGPWSIAGTAHGKPFRIELDEQGARIDLPSGRVDWSAGEDLAADLAPPHSGGLLPALYLWRRLATSGLDRFGEVYYLGTAPLPGHDGLADVLVATHGGVTCRFYFEPRQCRLLALEMFPADDADPCEIYFGDDRLIDGRAVPETIEVRFGDEIYGRFSVKEKGDITDFGETGENSWSPGMAKISEVPFFASKVVKVYGAGGFRGLEAYQSGFLISAEGHVLTAWSYVLDTDEPTVVLGDGRKFPARLVGADPRLEIAVLKIDARGLDHFDLASAVDATAGARVLALGNLFGVAVGNEPVSVQHGIVSVRTELDARRGAFDTPYHGPIYVLDADTNNPGAAGGAVVTLDGRLVGIIGKELRSSQNDTWLNYAVPIGALRGAVEQILAGRSVAAAKTDEQGPAHPLTLAHLGLVMVPEVLPRTPPYVDLVRPDSPADRAGLKADDLVVLLNGRLIQSCRMLREELALLERDAAVHLSVIRGSQLMEFTLEAAER